MNPYISRFFLILILMYSCSLESIQWSSPVTLFSTHDVFQPVVGVDSSANALIIATASDNGNNFYQKSAQVIDGAVQNVHNFSSANGPSSGGNAISLNSNGNAVAGWFIIDADTNRSTAVAAHFSGNSWSSPIEISNPQTNVAQGSARMNVQLRDDGTALAVWGASSTDFTTFAPEYSLFNGDVWSFPGNIINPVSSFISGVNFAGSTDGKGVAMWIAGSPPIILKASFFDGGGWEQDAGITFDVFTGECFPHNAIAMGSLNKGLLIWHTSNGGFSSLDSLGDAYENPQAVYTLLTNEVAQNVAVARNDDGTAFAILTVVNGVSNETKVITNRYVNGTWGTAVVLDQATDGTSFEFINIAMDARGNGLAVWQRNDLTNIPKVFYNRYSNSSGSWNDTSTLLSDPNVITTEPNLKMNSHGDAVVVWTIGTSGDQSAQAVRALGGPVPVSNFTGQQINNQFLFQSDLVNVLAWTPSPDSAVVSYFLFRNNEQIATIPASAPPFYQDHNRIPGHVYTYQLTSVDSDGTQSEARTVVVP